MTIFHVKHYTGGAPAYWASGVDVFFIISGFVMMCTLERQPTARQFLKARALRILPLYWCAVAVASLLIGPSVVEVLWNLVLVPGGEGALRPGMLVPQAWTLACEGFFYLVLTVAIAAGRIWLAPLVLLALGGAGLFEAGAVANSVQLEFLFGMALHRWRGLARWWMFPAGLALLYLLPPIPEYRGLLWGIPALMVVAGAVGAEPLMRVWQGPMLIGNASYAIYLFHLFALDATAGWLPVPLHLLVGLAAGVAVHLALERPMMAAIGGYLRRRSIAVAAAVPAVVARATSIP